MIPIALIHLSLLAAEAPQAPSSPVVWKGSPVGIRRTIAPNPLDLAPDGRSFVYLQGDPWPRIVLQRIAPEGGRAGGAEILGGVEPFGERPPRFDAEGRSVIFTGNYTPRSASAARPFSRSFSTPLRRDPPGEVLHLAVVRARPDGRPAERLLPGPGKGADDFAVFLDIHPGGRTLLAGTGSGLKAHQVPAGSFSLAIEELDLREDGAPAGPPRPLGFEANGLAVIRYSWDGTSILHGTGPAGRPGNAKRYDRSSGVHEDLPVEGEALGWLAGDLGIHPLLLAHPGSFGWDGFPAYLLARDLAGPAVPFSLAEPLAPLPPAPASFRGGRVLVTGGFEDRRTIAVLPFDPASFHPRETAGALRPGAGPILPGFEADRLLASVRDPRAGALLEGLRTTLAGTVGTAISAARARWLRRSPSSEGDPGPEIRIEATESIAGALSIRRTRPSGDREGPATVEEEIGWDGKEGWFIDGVGRSSASSRQAVLIEGAVCSPLRLLVDPAGLGLPWVEYRHIADEPDGKGALLEVLSADGWQSTLRVSIDGTRVLPVRFDAPILFPDSGTPRELGLTATEKTVSFEDWRAIEGRQVPGKILFDDGIAPFAMVLESLEINPEIPSRK